MVRKGGYQTLALLLQRKLSLINSHTLHMCLGLVSAGDCNSPLHRLGGGSPNSPAIPNIPAFVDLILDLELWCCAPGDLWKPLLEYFLELAKESPDRHNNLIIMRSVLQLVRHIWCDLGQFYALMTSCCKSCISCFKIIISCFKIML